MSLVSCPQCSGSVSPAAVTCPHCGHPLTPPAPPPAGWAGSQTGFWLMVVGGAIVILGSFIPWVRLGLFAVAGTQGDGAITAVLGVVTIGGGYGMRSGAGWARWLVRAVALAAVLIAGYDVNRITEATPLGDNLLGPGPGLVSVGAITAIVGSYLRQK